MEIKVIGSGSSGNCYLIDDGRTALLLDAGVPFSAVQQAMDSYDPGVIGFEWDNENPRIQLEPRGERGYIELRAVRRITK